MLMIEHNATRSVGSRFAAGPFASPRIGSALLLVALLPVGLPAEELRLTEGSVLGRVVSEGGGVIRVETPSGMLAIPAQAVVRRLPAEPRLPAYRSMTDPPPSNAADHARIARWCRDRQLEALAEKHIQAALELNPQNAEARELAGYLRVGGVWLFAGSPPDSREGRRANRPETVINSLQAGWLLRIRSIENRFLREDRGPQHAATGRAQLLSFEAPLAIAPACSVLGDGSVTARLALAEMLGGYSEDEAILNLLFLAIVDDATEVRQSAAVELSRIADARISALLRRGLRSDREHRLRRIAQVLGWMRDRSATDDLITCLSKDAFSTQRITPTEYLAEIRTAFDRPSIVPLDDRPVLYPPEIRFGSVARLWAQADAGHEFPESSFRTEVQDALVMITGENFGFDIQAWRDWSTLNPPLEMFP